MAWVHYEVLAANLSATPIELKIMVDDLYGDLDGRGSCELPQTLALPTPLYFCSFREQVSGEPGEVITDIITAEAIDTLPARNSSVVTATASVTIDDVPSDIKTFKIARPNSVLEPGGNISYGLRVQNASAVDEVTIDSLVDSLLGVPGGDCITPFTLAPGELFTCDFPGAVSGNAGEFRTNELTVSGVDDDGVPVSDRTAASVEILGADPTVDVRKVALPPVALDTGSPVVYLVGLHNTSSAADPVTITSLVDDIYG